MKSLWHDGLEAPSFPTLKEDANTDVLIIGGGITGLLTAYFLQEKGIPYILAEKEKICGGTTCNTTAKITYQHGLIFSKILSSMGLERSQMFYRANEGALRKFCEMCENIDCDFERKDNFVYSLSDKAKLENELKAAEKIGVKMKYKADLPLPISTVGGVYCENQAQFHPLKFLYQIAKNLNIYENTYIKEVHENTAITDKIKITAKKIIVATHYPFIDTHGSYFLKLYQHRSYVLALENAQDVNGMYVDENQKGLSFRNHGNMLLLGGGSHRTGKKGGNYNELRAFKAGHYPGSSEKYHWATQDCMSLDHVPYIGHYSKRTHEMYAASGFNKWGMTGSMVAAVILSDMVSGKKSEYREAFSPSRCIIKPQLFVNGFETTVNLLTPTKKRCPHLGCALKWNSAEKTWDCPCHGSRFTPEGKVLNNPANVDLM